jgi:hypothetical protein
VFRGWTLTDVAAVGGVAATLMTRRAGFDCTASQASATVP